MDRAITTTKRAGRATVSAMPGNSDSKSPSGRYFSSIAMSWSSRSSPALAVRKGADPAANSPVSCETPTLTERTWPAASAFLNWP